MLLSFTVSPLFLLYRFYSHALFCWEMTALLCFFKSKGRKKIPLKTLISLHCSCQWISFQTGTEIMTAGSIISSFITLHLFTLSHLSLLLTRSLKRLNKRVFTSAKAGNMKRQRRKKTCNNGAKLSTIIVNTGPVFLVFSPHHAEQNNPHQAF